MARPKQIKNLGKCPNCSTTGDCKHKRKRRHHNYYGKHKQEQRFRSAKARYGIDPSDYKQRLQDQDERCAICWEHRKLVIDHDHENGKLRGLICHRCNLDMRIIDNQTHLERLTRYKERYKPSHTH